MTAPPRGAPPRSDDLLNFVRPACGECVAFVGAGGKTTLMFALCDELLAVGHRTVASTTTKISPPKGRPLVLAAEEPDFRRAVEHAASLGRVVVAGDHIGDNGKVHGLSCDTVCDLLSRRMVDVVACESDGAAGRPLKLHGPREPVIPECARTVVVMAGCDAVGHPASPDTVHRADRISAVLRIQLGSLLRPTDIAQALVAASCHAPPGARVLFVVNKVDSTVALGAAREVAREVQLTLPEAHGALVSWGRVVEEFGTLASGSSAGD